VLDALEMLGKALVSGDRETERGLLRSILVANESYLHNPLLEELGELYREVLALERFDGYPMPELEREREDLMELGELYREVLALECLAQQRQKRRHSNSQYEKRSPVRNPGASTQSGQRARWAALR
jgi:hypothetical protein